MNGSARGVRTRKVSRNNSKSSLYDTEGGNSNRTSNCNGNYIAEERNNNHNISNNNNNNNNSTETQSKCQNCSPEKVVVRRIVDVVEQQNGDTMKCTVCRSNSNGGYRSHSSRLMEPSDLAGAEAERTSAGCGISSSQENSSLNINNNNSNTGHSVDGEVQGVGVGPSSQVEVNNDSCARTPKIVGKVGNLDSTQLLLSANINHNHHEQQLQGGETSGEREAGAGVGETSSGIVKNVEWKGNCEEQRQEMVMTRSSSENGHTTSSTDNNNSVQSSNNEEVEDATINLETSLRRRKSGFCEPSAEVRRRRSSGRLEDSVSVGTGS